MQLLCRPLAVCSPSNYQDVHIWKISKKIVHVRTSTTPKVCVNDTAIKTIQHRFKTPQDVCFVYQASSDQYFKCPLCLYLTRYTIQTPFCLSLVAKNIVTKFKKQTWKLQVWKPQQNVLNPVLALLAKTFKIAITRNRINHLNKYLSLKLMLPNMYTHHVTQILYVVGVALPI